MGNELKDKIDVEGLIDLLEVARLVVSTLDMDQVLEAILRSAMNLSGTPAGSVALYHKETQELELIANKGFSSDFVGNRKWKVREGGLSNEILKSKNPMVMADTVNKEFFTNPAAIKEGIRSAVCVPMYFEEEVVGILYVDDFKPREFADRQLRLLSILSSFAAMSIDHAKLHEITKKMALTDSLTGLFNRRHLEVELMKQAGRASRYGENFSIMMVDIDDFKKVNDGYGHPFGDKVLQTLSGVLRASIRVADIATRYGGEEFVIVLPMTDCSQAGILAGRILQNVRAASETLMDGKRPLTVSIGISCYPKDGQDVSVVVQKADEALYEAKRQGKDRAVAYGAGSCQV